MGLHLVTIIGPPAVGKMTVGQDFARRLDYRFLHNHLTFDVAHALHTYGSDAFFTLCDTLRLDCLRSAAATGTGGLVTTFCASGPGDIDFLNRSYRIVADAGGRSDCIALRARTDTLLERAVSPHRHGTNKLHDPAILSDVLVRNDFGVVPTNVPVCRIATDGMNAREVVEAIQVALGNRC